jgi:hypothetical protein
MAHLLGRRTIDLVANFGQARAHYAVMEKRLRSSETNSTDCWLFTGSKNTDGYGQIWLKRNADLEKPGKRPVAVLAHRLAFLARTGRNIVEHASHRCDNPPCFNPDHICDESAYMNNGRKGCPGDIVCSVHGHVIVALCPHMPKCIRPPRDDVHCCLSLAENDPSGYGRDLRDELQLGDTSMGDSTTDDSRDSIMSRASTEFEGAEWLEAAFRDGALDTIPE